MEVQELVQEQRHVVHVYLLLVLPSMPDGQPRASMHPEP